MGSDLSRCISKSSPPPTAKVITSAGDLRRYPIPSTASHVLAEETASSPSCFIANSDRLYYDELIPVLRADEELQANQIYFILPVSKLQNRLSAADMVAMAVKASTAIKRRRRCTARISPISVNMGSEMANEKSIGYLHNRAAMMSRSRSVTSFQRYTCNSRRAKIAVQPTSFKVRLGTIQEGTPL